MAVNTQRRQLFQLPLWQQAVFVLVFVLVSEVAGFSTVLTDAAVRLTTPVRQLWVRGFGGIFSLIESVEKLPKAAERIQDLQLRLAEASASLAELEALRRENEELRFLLSNTDRTEGRTIITVPIVAFSRPAIAVGSAAGVQEGAMVTSRSTLLGRVSEVGRNEAYITLLSDQDSQPVLARTNLGTVGLLVGDGRKLLFTEVEKTAPLAVGDQLVTAGQPQIQQGLPVGRVVRVDNDPARAVKSAVIEQYTSFFETPVVEVQ